MLIDTSSMKAGKYICTYTFHTVNMQGPKLWPIFSDYMFLTAGSFFFIWLSIGELRFFLNPDPWFMYVRGLSGVQFGL